MASPIRIRTRAQPIRGHASLSDKVDSRDLTKQSKEHCMGNQRENINTPKRDNRREGIFTLLTPGANHILHNKLVIFISTGNLHLTYTWCKSQPSQQACDLQLKDPNLHFVKSPAFFPPEVMIDMEAHKKYLKVLKVLQLVESWKKKEEEEVGGED
ncbi:hypothetical protein Tco_1018745 [Tanacetum coccineum]|uniref:Uncharacterized protein n=1 Tax=Tanacetum coccineum TaxID=301880 RepID=A0ABQ5FV83_9ASTR